MQFKIPQDVQRADTIVGPLTLRQLIILGIGGGLAYCLYVGLAKRYFMEIWLPPVVIISLLTVAFAFLKIHDLTFTRYLAYLAEYMIKPRKRVWKQMQGDVYMSVLYQSQALFQNKIIEEKGLTKEEKMKKLEEITQMVDSMHPGTKTPPATKIPEQNLK